MITHRLSTQPTLEPSVRFYKIIALSFLLVTVVLLGVVIFITSKKADIVIVTKEDNSSVNLTVKVTPDGAGSDAIKGTVTSTKFAWKADYQPTGNKKVDGLAKGTVTIYNKGSLPQPLVKTTRLLTSAGVLFHTAESVVAPANGNVDVSVYADQAGSTGDIGPATFTIPGLMEAKQKIVYAESTQPMSGGLATVGVLSETDIKNAEDSYRQKVKEEFLAKWKSAGGMGEPVVTWVGANTETNHKAGEEVSGFTVAGTTNFVVVSFNSADLVTLMNKEASNNIDTTSEKFLSIIKAPQATVSHFDLAGGSAELAVRQDVVVTLDANAPKLLPDRFFGKKKEEIERYILGLNHVAGVDVKFTPAWVFSAPTVAERIHVVVKNVQ